MAGAGLFLARFQVAYLARPQRGQIGVAPGPLTVMIRIGPDYLRHAEPLETVQVGNQDFFHPNFRWPVLCVGSLRPGMALPTLLRHIFEIVTYQNYATDDGLDPEACPDFATNRSCSIACPGRHACSVAGSRSSTPSSTSGALCLRSDRPRPNEEASGQ